MDPSRERLRTPRAAGLAGIVFAVLLAAAIVLMRLAIPEGATDLGAEALSPDRRRAVRAALELVPFAGIFFLWFMGALRAQVGEREDKLVATVFLGSGLVFVATIFGAASAAGSILADQQPSEFGRDFAYTLLTTYAMRMAAVFIFATSTIGHRLGVIPRPLTAVGYAAGLVLLFAGPSFPWSELVFPAWSAMIGAHLLRLRMRSRPQPADLP
ncbi:hypothetical protein SSP531S_40620 [Streptomyces spongiicola]|uniref:DUF4386 domain-containing protein n=1 Tax=Streptomyces spongiicola TaxID=1690221 RepID=A0A2S1Z4Y6_9ACTN|nr:hypothetical protein [Streptomyces spongiicola]AWK11390.1 hypothetical protein DDQ41_23535 [Streptomyces spongiicola]GBQ02603.1 hypothetical protein SSP531S_40620 [Streptomyces spongiicola]